MYPNFYNKKKEVEIYNQHVFEAIISNVNYENGTCDLQPADAVPKEVRIDDIPLPYWAGDGNAGIFWGISRNTRVVAAFTTGTSENTTVIIAIIPRTTLFPSAYSKKSSDDNGLIPYPYINKDDLVLRGSRNSTIGLQNDGDIIIKTGGGSGIYLNNNDSKGYYLLNSNDIINYSSAGRMVSGAVRRKLGQYNNSYNADITTIPMFADPRYYIYSDQIGLFDNSKVFNISVNGPKRNPGLAEWRFVVNEFLTDSMFTGFDDEEKRALNKIKYMDYSESYARNRQQGNILHLAEHELLEFVGGNVVDINGYILDLNYRKINYGNANKVPKTNLDIEYDRARRISRRGIGYHMQLSTNTTRKDPSQTQTNFVFDIDKEGLVKLNVPKSSPTGNIPFPSNAKFAGTEGDKVDVTNLNESIQENIPVTLRGSNGEVIYPKPDNKTSNNNGLSKRPTGVRYITDDYFPGSNNQESRINSTKYHNMYAVAERLIANKINEINIPSFDQEENRSFERKPFEVPLPEDDSEKEINHSTVSVQPSEPAIYWGGGGLNGQGIIIAGKHYKELDSNYPPFSNSFNSRKDSDGINISLGTSGEARDPGGKSISANLEGSAELSIGKDNWDGKSILLDTAGSIISWLGKDRNGRSAVVQTDGEVLLNIGGSYSGADSDEPVMNVGRFELRVNVTDKKFIGTSFENQDELDNSPGMDSDYIISISDQGLVIAGMKKDAKMIIRNDGDLLLESSKNLILKGDHSIGFVGPKGIKKILDPETQSL